MENIATATATRTPKPRKRNGQGSVSKKPNKKGYYTLTMTRDYRKKVFYFHKQGDAEAKRKELANQTNVNLGPELRVRDLLNNWLAETKGTVAASTLKRYRIYVEHDLIPAIGHIRLNELQTGDVHRMMTEATEGSRKREPVSNREANHLRTVLGTALNFAMARPKQYGLNWNPAMLTRPFPVDDFEAHAMTVGERERFEAALRGSRHEAAFTVALGYGLRQSELLGLTWGDINFDAGTLTVRKAMHEGKRGKVKSKKSRRELPLVLNFPELLRAYRAAQPIPAIAGGLVFATGNGTPFSGRNLTRDFKKVLKRAGLPESIRFHDLRHATASFLAAKGVPASVAQAILGHADIRTTLQVYTHAQDDAIRAGLEAINQR